MSTTLFEDGDWRICRTDHSNETIIMHMCRDEFNLDQTWWNISTENKCVYCRVMVPDAFLGLWRLHNWDRP